MITEVKKRERERKKRIFSKFDYTPKLYIPRTINTWRKLLSTAIWADKNGRVACTSSQTQNLDFIPESKIQFRIYFQQKKTCNVKKICHSSDDYLIFYCSQNPLWMPEGKVNV